MSNLAVLYDAPGPKAKKRAIIWNILAGIAVLGGLFWLYTSLAAPRTTPSGGTLPGLFDPSRWTAFGLPGFWDRVLVGVWGTVSVALVAAVIAVVIGIVFALLTAAKSPWIRIPTVIVIEFFRGMPVLLMVLFFLLIVFSGMPFWALVWALAVYNGALIGEILRAGLKALPRGQREAGLSIGLGSFSARMLIEFPQAFRQMTPIIVAQLVVLLKDTSLGYIIGYSETVQILMNRLNNAPGVINHQFSLFFLTIAIFLVLNLTLSAIARFLSRRLTGSKGSRKPRQRKGGPTDPADPVNDPAHLSMNTAQMQAGTL